MRRIKKALLILLTFVVVFTMRPAVFAAEGNTEFSDVSSDAWYADAVAYSKSYNLMSGTTETTFAPNAPMSRAMLATVLWRMDGSPSAIGAISFEDVVPGTWYTEAIRWANSTGIISGYHSQTFGTNDPVTREQIATLVFRYEEYKKGDIDIAAQLDFADSNQVRDWAKEAVAWAKQNNIMNGKPENLFDPQGKATRAEVASVLMGYLTAQQEQPKQSGTGTGKVLVAYFSRTGNTRAIANQIHEMVGGDIVEIQTVKPYPDDYDAVVKQAREERDSGYKPPLSTKVENMDSYDVVYLGHPIWGMTIPAPIASFLSEYDFSGKTIVPFCTHGGYGPGQSVTAIKELSPKATVLDGFDIAGKEASTAQEAASAWLREIGMLEKSDTSTSVQGTTQSP